MALNLRCADYGFECGYIISAETTNTTIEELRQHFEEEHGIDYSIETIIQMVTNRGHTINSIKK